MYRRERTLLWALVFSLPAIGGVPGAAAQEARGGAVARAVADEVYFPPAGDWWTLASDQLDQVGLDPERLDQAVQFALEHDSGVEEDLRTYIATTLANEPHGEIIGPTRERGATNGLIIRRGAIVAEWGPTRRVDMTFSVSKSYLSTVVGLAWDRGLIRDLDDRVEGYLPTDHFAGDKNGAITWDHLLRQTSDWQGTLFDKPDWADRPPRGATLEQARNVARFAAGERYEYNDVRVNLLALAALHVWRRPLPQILREEVMEPIGASRSWRWHGYENSWVVLDGLRMQSVSGGGHWGGGMFVSSRDHARFGYLFLRDGRWGDRQIISREFIERARTPGSSNPAYGYMNWFLNTERTGRDGVGRRALPSAPPDAVTFRGAGSNVIYIDRKNDLLIVVRWFDRQLDGLVERVLAAIEE